MHARVVLGVGKGVLFREVSSVQECPHRERERFHYMSNVCYYIMCVYVQYMMCVIGVIGPAEFAKSAISGGLSIM